MRAAPAGQAEAVSFLKVATSVQYLLVLAADRGFERCGFVQRQSVAARKPYLDLDSRFSHPCQEMSLWSPEP